jgi:hypothetical protein
MIQKRVERFSESASQRLSPVTPNPFNPFLESVDSDLDSPILGPQASRLHPALTPTRFLNPSLIRFLADSLTR